MFLSTIYEEPIPKSRSANPFLETSRLLIDPNVYQEVSCYRADLPTWWDMERWLEEDDLLPASKKHGQASIPIEVVRHYLHAVEKARYHLEASQVSSDWIELLDVRVLLFITRRMLLLAEVTGNTCQEPGRAVHPRGQSNWTKFTKTRELFLRHAKKVNHSMLQDVLWKFPTPHKDMFEDSSYLQPFDGRGLFESYVTALDGWKICFEKWEKDLETEVLRTPMPPNDYQHSSPEPMVAEVYQYASPELVAPEVYQYTSPELYSPEIYHPSMEQYTPALDMSGGVGWVDGGCQSVWSAPDGCQYYFY